jgi:glutathione S-transferase
MKLFHSATSPFVRKVLVCAIERGLDDRIERLPCSASPVKADPRVLACNPLGKIPALVTDDGMVLYDSPVICEYLDRLGEWARLFPEQGPARWNALRDQALADGLLDAAVLLRYEQLLREEACRSQAWIAGQHAKLRSALAAIDATEYGERVDIGTIAIGCALGYLDFRFPDLDWRTACPRADRWFKGFAARESMQRTVPHVADP